MICLVFSYSPNIQYNIHSKDLEVILTSFETYANGLSGSTLDGIHEEQFFAHIKYLKDAINLYKNQSETYTSNLLDKIVTLEKRQDQVDI
jgi:hypothetical protein